MNTKILRFVYFLIILALAGCAKQPQRPRVEEITFQSGEFTLVGDLVLPDGDGPFPVILDVPGSQPGERGTIIWKLFEEAGYASFSWDSPGYGESTGHYDDTVIEQRTQILLAAIQAMKAHPDIDLDWIGLFGGSQGGYVMPRAMLASDDIAFMICFSCPGLPGSDQTAYQIVLMSLCDGAPENAMEQITPLLAELQKAAEFDDYAGYVRYHEILAAVAELAQVDMGNRPVMSEETWRENATANAQRQWNPVWALRGTHIPILSIIGSRDRNMDPFQAAYAWRQALAQNGNPHSRLEVFAEADHNMLNTAHGCKDEMSQEFDRWSLSLGYASTDEMLAAWNADPYNPDFIRKMPFVPGVLDLTRQWLKGLRSQPAGPTSTPVAQPTVGSHPPVILRVVKRQQVSNGFLYFHHDVYFMDPKADAVEMTSRIASSSLTYPPNFTDTPIEASAEQQRVEAFFTETIACWQKMELVYEGRIRDKAGNLSEPVSFTISCTAPQPLDTKPLLVSGLSTAISIGLVLLLGFWLLFRKHPAERLPALRSMILISFLFMIIRLLHLVIHEGGHSLYFFVRGVPVTMYVHPFFFRGFSRPIIVGADVWKDILGSAAALPAGLLIFMLFWKRRSLALLPWVMLFPFIALGDGFNVMGIQDDFRNLVQSTGLPAAPFFILGALIFCIGLISMFSLFPLAGLDPRDNKTLFVLPAAMYLISALSFLVEHLFVPGSPIDLEYFMGREILSDNLFIPWVSVGIVLAVLYVTLFRKLYPRLPAWLRTETVALTWKDLRLPAMLAVICVALGLIIIT